LTATSEEADFASVIEDIVTLARKLAEKEPYKSASGPEALPALATHLDGMVASDRAGPPGVIRVAVRKTKDR
jgi:hypothetical protein